MNGFNSTVSEPTREAITHLVERVYATATRPVIQYTEDAVLASVGERYEFAVSSERRVAHESGYRMPSDRCLDVARNICAQSAMDMAHKCGALYGRLPVVAVFFEPEGGLHLVVRSTTGKHWDETELNARGEVVRTLKR